MGEEAYKLVDKDIQLRLEAVWEKYSPLPHDDEDIKDFNIISSIIGPPGVMGTYNQEQVKNGNICTDKRKLWFGDLYPNKQRSKLQKIANELGKKIYILREKDARFENERKPLLDKSVAVFEPVVQ